MSIMYGMLHPLVLEWSSQSILHCWRSLGPPSLHNWWPRYLHLQFITRYLYKAISSSGSLLGYLPQYSCFPAILIEIWVDLFLLQQKERFYCYLILTINPKQLGLKENIFTHTQNNKKSGRCTSYMLHANDSTNTLQGYKMT